MLIIAPKSSEPDLVIENVDARLISIQNLIQRALNKLSESYEQNVKSICQTLKFVGVVDNLK